MEKFETLIVVNVVMQMKLIIWNQCRYPVNIFHMCTKLALSNLTFPEKTGYSEKDGCSFKDCSLL